MKKTKVYIAASYPRKAEAAKLAKDMKKYVNYEVISGWMFEDEGYTSDERVAESVGEMTVRMEAAALRDFDEVMECNLLVCLTDGDVQLTRGGRHSELGIALGMGKDVVIIGEREQVFHYHQDVVVYSCVEEFLKSL